MAGFFVLRHAINDYSQVRHQFIQEKNDQDCGAHRFVKLIQWENNDWRSFWQGRLGVVENEVPPDLYVLAFAEGAFSGIA